MLTARFYNNVLRVVAFLCLVIGILGFLIDFTVRMDYTVALFDVSGSLMNAVIWLVVWLSAFAFFMVFAHAAEHIEVIYRRTRD